MEAKIPVELLEMLRERRVIPFIGSGFSASHGLPDWDTLLKQVSLEVSNIPSYDEIKKCCNGDYLQIAEYLFIKSDRSIGPLRHKFSTLLHGNGNYLYSTQHIELINLNPQQIYTTNYDEVIEQTCRALDHPFAFVALPKHIAESNKGKTQVVKYHGDLRYDQSLVLTESSYYNRLEFESPMDLKFRSDLLGQSVLFVGYSFRDINIRIIWFKLMEMMKDVPESDRPSSYIVRFEKNEVLEDLYRAVGIRTICLDPNGRTTTSEDRTKLLNQFMLDLTCKVSVDARMPQSSSRMYMSKGLLEEIVKGISARRDRQYPDLAVQTRARIDHAINRRVPPSMLADVDELLGTAARIGRYDVLPSITRWAARQLRQTDESSRGASFAVIRGLLRESSRDELFGEADAASIPWARIWSTKLSDNNAEALVKAILQEVENHGEFQRDHDLAYAIDIANRILSGSLISDTSDSTQQALKDAIKKAADMYPSISSIQPNPEGMTDLENVLREIQNAIDAEPEDEIPF